MILRADKSSPFQMVQSLASQLQEVPAEDVLLSLHHVPQVLQHTSFIHTVEDIPRQGRLEGCHRVSAAMHLICGLEGVNEGMHE